MSSFIVNKPIPAPPSSDGRSVKSRQTAVISQPQATATPARRELLNLACEADKLTGDRSSMIKLQTKLQGMQRHHSDPHLQAAVHLQNVLMQSYLMGPMRNPKVVESENPLEQAYAKAAAKGTDVFLFGCAAGASVLNQKNDAQRCAVNLGADACLLGLDGGLGVSGKGRVRPENFVNAVRTSISPKLVTLQAQGPKTAEQVDNLVSAATGHAARTECDRIVFVNASTDKVPSFKDAVLTASASTEGLLTYRELDWIDGEVPKSAEGRARIVDFVHALSQEVLSAQGRTMVVFNCHIGLDRSGVTNALTQLMVDHGQRSDILEAASDVLAKLKRARPHAISTVFRFQLIVSCLQDLRAKLSA